MNFIIIYLLELNNKGIEMPEEKAQEFKMMLEDMDAGAWNEDRRFIYVLL